MMVSDHLVAIVTDDRPGHAGGADLQVWLQAGGGRGEWCTITGQGGAHTEGWGTASSRYGKNLFHSNKLLNCLNVNMENCAVCFMLWFVHTEIHHKGGGGGGGGCGTDLAWPWHDFFSPPACQLRGWSRTCMMTIQRRAARFVVNDYDRRSSVTTILSNLQCETLENRRTELRLIALFKEINVHKLTPSNVPFRQRLSSTQQTNGTQNTRNTLIRLFYQHSFYPRTTREWNLLPPDLRSISNINAFQKQTWWN